jgi:cell shape-determining protein MreC
MAKSPTERVTTLERQVDTHIAQLEALVQNVKSVSDSHADTAKELATLKRDVDREVALLKREVEELKKWQDNVKKNQEEWGRKLWMILPPVLAVLISNALTLAITRYFK